MRDTNVYNEQAEEANELLLRYEKQRVFHEVTVEHPAPQDETGVWPLDRVEASEIPP